MGWDWRSWIDLGEVGPGAEAEGLGLSTLLPKLTNLVCVAYPVGLVSSSWNRGARF